MFVKPISAQPGSPSSIAMLRKSGSSPSLSHGKPHNEVCAGTRTAGRVVHIHAIPAAGVTDGTSQTHLHLVRRRRGEAGPQFCTTSMGPRHPRHGNDTTLGPNICALPNGALATDQSDGSARTSCRPSDARQSRLQHVASRCSGRSTSGVSGRRPPPYRAVLSSARESRRATEPPTRSAIPLPHRASARSAARSVR